MSPMRRASCAVKPTGVGRLEAQMMAHADRFEYELAAELRNQIQSLSRVLQQQVVESARPRAASATSTSWPSRCRAAGPASTSPWCAAAATWATGLSSRSIVDDATALHLDDEPVHSPERLVLEAFIAQHYLASPVPQLIVISEPVDEELADALAVQTGSRVTLQAQPRGQRRIWLDMCMTGAELALTRLLSEEGSPASAHAPWWMPWTCRAGAG